MRQHNNNPAQINYVKRTSYFTAVGKYHIVWPKWEETRGCLLFNFHFHQSPLPIWNPHGCLGASYLLKKKKKKTIVDGVGVLEISGLRCITSLNLCAEHFCKKFIFPTSFIFIFVSFCCRKMEKMRNGNCSARQLRRKWHLKPWGTCSVDTVINTQIVSVVWKLLHMSFFGLIHR